MTPEQQRSEFKQICPPCPVRSVGQYNPAVNDITQRYSGYKTVQEIKWNMWYDCVVTFDSEIDDNGVTLMSRACNLGGIMILPRVALVPGFIQIYDGGLKAYKKVK